MFRPDNIQRRQELVKPDLQDLTERPISDDDLSLIRPHNLTNLISLMHCLFSTDAASAPLHRLSRSYPTPPRLSVLPKIDKHQQTSAHPHHGPDGTAPGREEAKSHPAPPYQHFYEALHGQEAKSPIERLIATLTAWR
ncbi:uncharacterized protein CLUP02_07409 [Colletotrichum lupini]|uniref:Uncharacterized protein n=1 Tax=Colletotrichum lupini TaxID=145971 RepID=A0A9Q8WFM7_9PEZI|nr:uncharacterized protein CLUP02_07409 [Colletotrichum lupini]UQC81923.1 hypothetical protein CLUP02_07409 [Colletotrichum lupini]